RGGSNGSHSRPACAGLGSPHEGWRRSKLYGALRPAWHGAFGKDPCPLHPWGSARRARAARCWQPSTVDSLKGSIPPMLYWRRRFSSPSGRPADTQPADHGDNGSPRGNGTWGQISVTVVTGSVGWDC